MHIKDLGKALFPYVKYVLKGAAGVLDGFSQKGEKNANALQQLNSIYKDKRGSCLLSKNHNSQQYDLEVIVPCYNVEQYVARCVHSILQQETQYSFRVLLIDDGSTDGTAAILDSFAEHENVVVVHKANEGPGAARNTGLKLLNSKYVMFVDSDDLLSEGAIETLVNLAYAQKAKLVNGNFVYIDEKDKIVRGNPYKQKEGTVNPKEEITGFCWGKVFAAELFQEVGFPEEYLFEDTAFRQIYCRLLDTGYNTDRVVYKYRYRPNSISCLSKTSISALDSLYVYLKLHEDSKYLGLVLAQSDYEYLMEHIMYTAFRCRNLPLKVQKLVFAAWRDFLEQEMSSFSTEKAVYRELEQSLKQGKFWSYLVISIFSL